jgi:hypothetical protein
MSSPSQIDEPSERPRSGLLPPSTNPTTQQGKTYKAYGQDYQYAERLSNPPPEFVVGTYDPGLLAAPALPIAGTDGAGDAGANDIESPIRHPSSSNSQKRESVWVPPPAKPWYKKIPKMWWLSGVITLVGTTAVLLAILGAMGILGGRS